MAGYANRTLTLDFPHLSDPEDPADLITVTIRNPRLLPTNYFNDAKVKLPPLPPMADLDEAARLQRIADYDDQCAPLLAEQSRQMLAKLIIDWHVYDYEDPSPDPTPLPLPPTAELTAKLPIEIVKKINTLVEEAQTPQ